MSRILIAVSSPWASQKVVETVSDLASRISAEVLVVHVSRPSGGQMREQEQADGEAAISYLRTKLEEKSIAVQTLLMFSDDIARAILNTAAERQCTLIILGLTGKSRQPSGLMEEERGPPLTGRGEGKMETARARGRGRPCPPT